MRADASPAAHVHRARSLRRARPRECASARVFVDPRTHAILGQRDYWTWFRLLHSFHSELLVPGAGERTVGALGLPLLASVIAARSSGGAKAGGTCDERCG
ncbi:MAG: PepSY-associated TM helix domain-containing protein [Steroidobacteraceae bacterium]